MFKTSSDHAYSEIQDRAKQSLVDPLLFGVEYLDDATDGIFPDDIVLLSGSSGAGKTQAACHITRTNILRGKRVHYIALEASELEIERRLKYPIVLSKFLADPNRPNLGEKISYPKWLRGKYLQALEKHEMAAAEEFERVYKNLKVYYKTDKFGVNDLIETVCYCANETDLIIIDHVHYFDFDDENENRAIKQIAMTARSLALERKRPILLIAHLRKRDRFNDDLVPGMEELHGSSDLFKIATKVIMFSQGQQNEDGTYDTFFRIPKNRNDGRSVKFIGREHYSYKSGGYDKGKYEICWAGQKQSEGFVLIAKDKYPDWSAYKRGLRP